MLGVTRYRASVSKPGGWANRGEGQCSSSFWERRNQAPPSHRFTFHLAHSTHTHSLYSLFSLALTLSLSPHLHPRHDTTHGGRTSPQPRHAHTLAAFHPRTRRMVHMASHSLLHRTSRTTCCGRVWARASVSIQGRSPQAHCRPGQYPRGRRHEARAQHVKGVDARAPSHKWARRPPSPRQRRRGHCSGDHGPAWRWPASLRRRARTRRARARCPAASPTAAQPAPVTPEGGGRRGRVSTHAHG
eukprot:scaffold7987_cov105-Isochrysis_galbana.AAC.4